MARLPSASASRIDRIDALLPQTQCQRCGYPGCRPYAEAIAKGEADINQCPPGGAEGVKRLARLLDVEPKPLDEFRGILQSTAVAVIDESSCIGCAQCLAPCPVDAIIGAPQQVHTVISSWCTGCELCVAPCPVDCISMRATPESTGESKWQRRRREITKAAASRARHAFHLFRIERSEQERAAMHERSKPAAKMDGAVADPRQAAIAAAIARAQARQGRQGTPVNRRESVPSSPALEQPE